MDVALEAADRELACYRELLQRYRGGFQGYYLSSSPTIIRICPRNAMVLPALLCACDARRQGPHAEIPILASPALRPWSTRRERRIVWSSASAPHALSRRPHGLHRPE